MRNPWHQVTLIRVVVPLIAGIATEVLADYFGLPVKAIAILSAILFALSLIAAIAYGFIDVAKQYKWRNWNGATLSLMIGTFGFSYAYLYADIHHAIHFSNTENISTYVVRISEPPIDKPKTINAIAEVEEVVANGKYQKTIGRVLLKFSKDEPALIAYGDVVAFKADVKLFAAPLNPEQFNYKQYQTNHNIFYTAYLNSDSWEKVGSEGNLLFTYIYKIRDSFLKVLRRYVKDERDFGVATALMLGYRDYISDDIMHAYSSSGAIHILSVSGMHVGIMFIMLNVLLGWVDERNRKAAITKSIFIIGFIWFYACLTGLSPSVLRSAMMFTVIQIGAVMLRHSNMYNVLAGSALLIILTNPLIITDVGFQLSYLAVVGIVYLYPMVNSWLSFGRDKPKHKDADWYIQPLLIAKHDKLWVVKTWLPNFIWQIIAVSVAAQLATAPLALYYFHQFPWLFLPANIVTVVISNFVMLSGTALFAFSWLPYLSDALATCFSQLLHWLNQFTFWIDSMPAALQRYISIYWWEAVIILLLVWLIAEYFKEKEEQKQLVRAPVIILLLVAGLAIWNSYEGLVQGQQQKLVVYNVMKKSAVAYIDRQKVHYAMDSSVIHDRRTMNYNIDNHWAYLGIDARDEAQRIELPFGRLISMNGKQMLQIDKNAKPIAQGLKEKLNVDYVIISHNAQVDMLSLNNICNYKQIIFDTSNKPKQLAKWKDECSKLNIAYYDVNDQGAFVVDL